MALDRGRGVLYVADTLNDRLRLVNLGQSDLVTTPKPSNLAPNKRREVELGTVREDLTRELADEGKVRQQHQQQVGSTRL